MLGDAGIGDAIAAVLALADLGEALIDLERIAAGGDEIDHGVEIGAREAGEGRRHPHLVVQLVRHERLAAGAAQHVLGQHVERAGAQRRSVLRPLGDRLDGGLAFEHLEAIGRDSTAFEGSSSRWLARPMRWVRREAPLGAPTLMTRSTSPQSMPRSSEEVHTTACSRPAAIAASILRRWAASSEP